MQIDGTALVNSVVLFWFRKPGYPVDRLATVAGGGAAVVAALSTGRSLLCCGWWDEEEVAGLLAYEQCLALPIEWIHDSPILCCVRWNPPS